MEKVRRKRGFHFSIDVPTEGTMGALVWGEKMEVSISLKSFLR